jgi:hypothetical protein
MHTLYADGVHDDTEALQALIHGEPVMWRGSVITDSRQLPPQRYFIGSTLEISVENPLFPLSDVRSYGAAS